MKFNVNDIIGKKFNKLTVLKFDHKIQMYVSNGIKNGFKYYYLCQCDCGNKIIVSRHHLQFNHTRSCGCITNIHNLTNTRIFRIWSGLLSRCYNKNAVKYKNYGGRGIIVCEEWKKDFKIFYDWALNNGYKDKLTIDRIDVNGNYCPKNCRWVDMKTQQNNRSNNHLLEFKGQTHTISEWAEIIGIKRETIKTRLHIGWPVEKVLTTPIRVRNLK